MARVLVVDDSALMRKKLREMLEPKGYEVIIARDGADALIKARECSPDLITLDINMPRLDGLSALAALLTENPRHKVIMFSSLTQEGAQATMEALALGAYDFLPKPGGTISLSLDEVEAALLELIEQVIDSPRARPSRRPGLDRLHQKTVLSTPVRRLPSRPKPLTASERILAGAAPTQSSFEVTLIGVSTGGPRCVETILSGLPANYPNPVLIAQHMPGGFTEAFAQRLDTVCPLKVMEVSTSAHILPGHVYVAKGNADMAVNKRGGQLIAQRRPMNEDFLWHPSVSVMVDSAMRVIPAKQLVGVMLTGMGYDGAEEMAALKRAGGFTIAESENTSVVFGMPKELISRDGACEVLDREDIAQFLVELSHQKYRRHHGVC